MERVYPHAARPGGDSSGKVDASWETGYPCRLANRGRPVYWGRFTVTGARSSMDRVLPSEGRGCWFDPSRARQTLTELRKMLGRFRARTAFLPQSMAPPPNAVPIHIKPLAPPSFAIPIPSIANQARWEIHRSGVEQ